MPRASRSFHIHVSQHDDTQHTLRWSVTRSMWKLGSKGVSAELGRGQVDVEVFPASTPWVAVTVLEIALASFRAQLENDTPEDRP